MPQILSNFEFNSKLPNFTRDSFETWAEMEVVNPSHMDEGHISYCKETEKHYIYHTGVGNDGKPEAKWTLLSAGGTSKVKTLEELKTLSVEPGSLVLVSDGENPDQLYFKLDKEHYENSETGDFKALLTEDQLGGLFLLKSEAEDIFLKKIDARESYLLIDEASDTYLSIEDAQKNYLSQSIADNRYAKKSDIQNFSDDYVVGDESLNYQSWNQVAKDLNGLTGQEINDRKYTFGGIIDEILFSTVEPTISQPSIEIEVKNDYLMEVGGWYDEKENIMVVPVNYKGPGLNNFNVTNVVNAVVNYPIQTNYSTSYTDGIDRKPSSSKQTSDVFCKVKNASGEWVYYSEGYYRPTTLTNTGDYRYYFVSYFNKANPAYNNKNEVISSWNEDTPVESINYITLNASKPTRKNTKEGLQDNPLLYWSDEMVDYFELDASCIAVQKFQTPRRAKKIYIWNDLCEYIQDFSFNEVVSGDYYTYTYNHTLNGHRGSVKIKVEF